MKKTTNSNTPQKSINWKSLCFLISGILGQIIIYFITNSVGFFFHITIYETIFISVILIIFGFICWFSIAYMLMLFERRYFDKNSKAQDYNKENFDFCLHNNTICCLSRALNESGLNLTISPEEKEKNRLYTVSEINMTERFSDTHKWTNIWVFSENLSTEVDGEGTIEPIPQININKGVKYVEFYLQETSDKESITKRVVGMTNSINVDKKENLEFCPLNTGSGYIGKNTLPLLCGSILLSTSCVSENETISFDQGYLSMRKSLKDKPIYYKMPKCMLEEYSSYFKEKYDSYNKEAKI